MGRASDAFGGARPACALAAVRCPLARLASPVLLSDWCAASHCKKSCSEQELIVDAARRVGRFRGGQHFFHRVRFVPPCLLGQVHSDCALDCACDPRLLFGTKLVVRRDHTGYRDPLRHVFQVLPLRQLSEVFHGLDPGCPGRNGSGQHPCRLDVQHGHEHVSLKTAESVLIAPLFPFPLQLPIVHLGAL